MQTCFVIQPFDLGKFDRRFRDVYKPALEDAGLVAYRVDKDPSVQVPIDAIHDGINEATICLADITTDNPNVWYELGYAVAADCPVIMICSNERQGKFPFDIQHRSIIRYASDSPSDFEELKDKISEKAQALLEEPISQKGGSKTGLTTPTEELSETEITVLKAFLENATVAESEVYLYSLEREMVPSELTPVQFKLAFQELKDKSFIKLVKIIDEEDGEPTNYNGARITPDGWDWIKKNKSYFDWDILF